MLLITKEQDVSVLSGHQKSAKHTKAKQYTTERQPRWIMGKTEILVLLKPEQM